MSNAISYEVTVEGQPPIIVFKWAEACEERDRLRKKNPGKKVEIKRVRL